MSETSIKIGTEVLITKGENQGKTGTVARISASAGIITYYTVAVIDGRGVRNVRAEPGDLVPMISKVPRRQLAVGEAVRIMSKLGESIGQHGLILAAAPERKDTCMAYLVLLASRTTRIILESELQPLENA